MTDLPHRPRLADAALLRRHRINGADVWLLHDTSRNEVLELTPRQVEQCLVFDGTRDLGGVLLASARRGAYRRASEVIGLLTDLADRGLLADGTEPPAPQLEAPDTTPVVPADRPLEVLPFRLRCDGGGSCCMTYGSIPFSPDEQRRADAAVPEVAETLGEHRFLPLHGAEPSALRSMTTLDGACAFLEDGLCRIHARAGMEAKPRACQAYPAQLVDDGEAVRVSVAVECVCVLTSLHGEGGQSLVSDDIRLSSLLPSGTSVPMLPDRIAVTSDTVADRAALRAFTSAVLDIVPDEADGVALAWSLARHLEAAKGLCAPDQLELDTPSPEELAPWLSALHAQLRDKCLHVGWRSPRDRSRLRSDWLCNAAASLLDAPVVASTMAAQPTPRDEAFTLRASLWGYQILTPDLVTGLRDRAIRFLVARRCHDITPDAVEPAASHPIAAVEAMMRGQGIGAYVTRLR